MGDREEGPRRDTELAWLLGREDVGTSGDTGKEYLFRPGEILVVEEDLDADLRAELEDWGIHERDEPSEEEEEKSSALAEIGVIRFGLPHDVDVGTVVSNVRRRRDGPIPRLSPHHLFIGEPTYHGGPGQDVAPTTAAGPELTLTQRHERGVTVGVLDTGVRTEHPWLAHFDVNGVGSYFNEDQRARLDADSDDELDRQSGHGTFVAGLILQQAPSASVRVCSVLDSHGVGDEASIVAGIRNLLNSGEEVDILNLSLGGYTRKNMPPISFGRLFTEISSRGKGIAVVAAAGNNSRSRPFWPAAFKRVIAVAALTRDGAEAAPFTNRGWWVDACASGMDLKSTFVDWEGKVARLAVGQRYDFPGWAVWGGTSFAAPLVAGTIAARAASDGIDVTRAAFECVGAAGLEFKPDLGAVVDLARPLPPLAQS
jgi:subtilisin family serine protease